MKTQRDLLYDNVCSLQNLSYNQVMAYQGSHFQSWMANSGSFLKKTLLMNTHEALMQKNITWLDNSGITITSSYIRMYVHACILYGMYVRE